MSSAEVRDQAGHGRMDVEAARPDGAVCCVAVFDQEGDNVDPGSPKGGRETAADGEEGDS